MADDISQYIQGLQLLGGLLSLPRTAQYQQEEQLRNRAMLQGSGMEGQANELFPDAPLGFLRAGPGVGGKILGGIGDVGSILSTIAGRPVGPPRHDITDIANAAKLRKSFQEQKTLDELAKTEKDPVALALLKTGTMDGYARYKAAQARGAGGGTFGTSSLGQRARLHYLEQNEPDSPEIPALRKGIAEEDLRHPVTTPAIPLTPAQRVQEKLDTDRQLAQQQHDRRVKEALDAGYKENTPEFNRMVYGSTAAPPRTTTHDKSREQVYLDAWNREVQRARALPGEEPDRARAQADADETWYTLHPEQRPKQPPADTGGAGGTQQAPPPPPPEKLPPEATPGAASYAEPPGTPTATTGTPGVTPEQLAAITKLQKMAMDQGVDPRGLASAYPDLWAASGLAGTERLSTEEFYKLLGDPVALAAWRAQQSSTTPTPQQGTPAPPDSPISKPFDFDALTPEGKQQALAIQGQVQRKELDQGVGAARLQALPRLPGR
jgi:hypothetical protein